MSTILLVIATALAAGFVVGLSTWVFLWIIGANNLFRVSRDFIGLDSHDLNTIFKEAHSVESAALMAEKILKEKNNV